MIYKILINKKLINFLKIDSIYENIDIRIGHIIFEKE